MILAIKTSDETSELCLLENIAGAGLIIKKQEKWQAGRELGKTLLSKIEQFLQLQASSLQGLSGLIVFSGPGSFTGLRIGNTTMNAISYGQKIPIVGVDGNDWLEVGIKRLKNGENDKIVIPNYGSAPKITKPSK